MPLGVALVIGLLMLLVDRMVALHALGETINLMTLGGLTLAIGILVDDATVTIENIERHLHLGKDLYNAIFDGASEIAVPALGAVLLAQAMKLSGMMGILGTMLADALPVAGLTAFAAYWLGGRIFLREAAFPGLELAPERRGEGRFLATLIGVLLAAQMLIVARACLYPASRDFGRRS